MLKCVFFHLKRVIPNNTTWIFVEWRTYLHVLGTKLRNIPWVYKEETCNLFNRRQLISTHIIRNILKSSQQLYTYD